MSFRRNLIKLQNGNFLINKIKTKIITCATSLNISFENVFKTSIKANYYYTIITTKLLQ